MRCVSWASWALTLAACSGLPAAAWSVARDAGPAPRVVLALDAIPAERTAATEVASYLGRALAREVRVVDESEKPAEGPTIYVGPTRFAALAGIQCETLGAETWVLRTHAQALILAGGRPRGTLYAAYHFLEDQVGVRWWTPWEEEVPSLAQLALPDLDRSGRPAFPYRDVGLIEGPRDFCARGRLNGHHAGLGWEHGGSVRYGPPSASHSYYAYVPPDPYFHSHPEYFSERRGTRTADKAQLCLTNPGLFELVAAKLEGYIEQSRAEASRRGEPAPVLFDFSSNDWGRACACATCSALARREDTTTAPLVAFLDRLADRIAAKHPEVLLHTLAYYDTFWPPAQLGLHERIVVQLSALQRRDFTKPVTHPVHWEYQHALADWRAKTKHLHVWDYSVTFGRGDLPLPNLPVLAADFRHYLASGVEGLFVQHDHTIDADMRDLKLWILLKLLEDPQSDLDALIREFTDGYYGAAGSSLRRYLSRLERAASRKPTFIGYPSKPSQYRYLDLSFLERAHGLFDRAEQRVAGDPVLLRRVRHARLSLDRATLLRLKTLRSQWQARPRLWRGRPPDIDAIAARYRQTWYEQIELRAPERRAAERARVDGEIERIFASVDLQPL